MRYRSLLVLAPLSALLLGTSLLHAAVTPISVTPAPTAALTYVQPATPGAKTLAFVSSTLNQFVVDPATVPVWLTVSPMSGQAAASPGTNVVFTPNALCASLGTGLYKATVSVSDVLAGTTLSIPVSVVISPGAPTVTIREGAFATVLNAQTLALDGNPSYTLTLVSSGAPVSFSAVASSETYTGGGSIVAPTAWMKISPASGVAYSWGTPITVSVDSSAWAQASVTGVFGATITISYGVPATVKTVGFQLTVTPPAPTIAYTAPSALPSIPSGASATFMIAGTNFVPQSTLTLVTAATPTVPLTGASPDFNFTVLSANAILVNILGTGTNVAAGKLSIATTATLTGITAQVSNSGVLSNPKLIPITALPIISSITSASSFIQTTGHPTIAPYDVISIFGTNLCPTCSPAVIGTATPGVNPVTAKRFPTALSGNANVNYVQVYFLKASDSSVVGQGSLLFATNTQLNVLVPAGVTGAAGALLGKNASDGTGKLTVAVSYSLAASLDTYSAANSGLYNVIAAAYNPGIFAVDATGQGQGAILNFDGSYNSASGANGTSAARGSIIQIFMTGLGVPDSTATDAATTSAIAYPGSCLAAVSPATAGTATAAPASYLAAVNTILTAVSSGTTLYAPPSGTGTYAAPSAPAWTTLDGALIQSAFIPDLAHHYAPCLKTAPVVTVGGKPATVKYAGWVTDSVVGLYQVNVQLPTSNVLTTIGDKEILVTVGTAPNAVTSPSGVTVNVN